MSTDVFSGPMTASLMSQMDRARAIGQRALIILWHVASPRGRADRRGLFVIAIGLLAVQIAMFALSKGAGIAIHPTLKTLLSIPMAWLAYTTTTKRLHDIGRSAWMIPLAIAFWMVGATGIITLIILFAMFNLGIDASGWSYFFLAIFALPAFGGLLWLHCAPGDEGDNFYGPITDDTGFATPASADIIGVSPMAYGTA